MVERWTGVKELTESPFMQANPKAPPPANMHTLLHPGSLHFNTLLKLQITKFLATEMLILRNFFLSRQKLALAGLGCQQQDVRIYSLQAFYSSQPSHAYNLFVVISLMSNTVKMHVYKNCNLVQILSNTARQSNQRGQ